MPASYKYVVKSTLFCPFSSFWILLQLHEKETRSERARKNRGTSNCPRGGAWTKQVMEGWGVGGRSAFWQRLQHTTPYPVIGATLWW